ncbi:MAG: TetR/AcrR family transcriptional regulator [Ruminococcus sp.]|nr:TetR/AcrR family transcriptional regulator [Ruminococcus sp.]
MENNKTDSKSQKTYERIMDCALILFKEKGYNNVTLQEICRKAGITKSTFYYHYDSKETLIINYTDRISRNSQEDFSQILAQDTFIKQIWELFDRYNQKNMIYGPAVVRQVYRSTLNSKDKADFPRDLMLFPTLVTLIQRSQSAGEITNESDAEELAASLYYASRGLTFSWALQDGAFSVPDRFKAVINSLLLPVPEHRL